MASRAEKEGDDKLGDDLKTVQGDDKAVEEDARSRQNDPADVSAVAAAGLGDNPEAPHAGSSSGGRDVDVEEVTKDTEHTEEDVNTPRQEVRAQIAETDDKGPIAEQQTHHTQHEREASHRTQEQHTSPRTETEDKLILEKFTLYKTESVRVPTIANTSGVQPTHVCITS